MSEKENITSKVLKIASILLVVCFIGMGFVEIYEKYEEHQNTEQALQQCISYLFAVFLFGLMIKGLIHCCRKRRKRKQMDKIKDIVINIHIEGNPGNPIKSQQIRIPLKPPEQDDKDKKLISHDNLNCLEN